jgi:hypothetical protein
MWRQGFERRMAPETQILGLVHHTHTTPAEVLDDFVMRYDAANHLSYRWIRGAICPLEGLR